MPEIIKSPPLHHQVYQAVKKMLLEGEFEPGERLIEVKLADALGVSRAPVREAIRMLIQDGLLVQKEGFVQVFNPTSKDIMEIFQCRQSLESLSASLAAKHISKEQLAQLAAIIEQTKAALSSNNTSEISKLDQQFHDIIVEASHNHELIQLMEIIKAKVYYVRNCIIRNFYQNFLTFIDEHVEIYNALLERNAEKAEDAMGSHIEKNLNVSYLLY